MSQAGRSKNEGENTFDEREKRHRRIRRMTRWYPSRDGALLFSRIMGKVFARSLSRPLWLATEPYDGYPAMELDISTLFHRKIFYFPRAYGARWMSEPFAHFLQETLRPGDVFFDIGANVGYYTLMAARLVGAQGAVCAFEPDPLTNESLTRTLALNQVNNVHVVMLALSDREATLPLYITDDSAHSLLAGTKNTHHKVLSTSEVRVSTLDRWMQETDLGIDWQKIKLLKIDVEGEEPRTVGGMKEFLVRAGKPQIWCEVRGPKGSKRAPNTFAEVYERLKPLGYTAYLWNTRGRREVGVADVIKREDVLFIAR